jgi:hypothetical protein
MYEKYRLENYYVKLGLLQRAKTVFKEGRTTYVQLSNVSVIH